MPDYGVKGLIPWLYYRDLPGAMEFYEEVMGFEMVVDQGWSKRARACACNTSVSARVENT